MSSQISRKVDWLSWTHPITLVGEGDGAKWHEPEIDATLRKTFPEGMADAMFGNLAALDYGRSPYKFGWRDQKQGITLWASPTLKHFCVEVSGKGCDILTQRGWLEPVIGSIAHRLTRIDIAVDMETDVAPSSFASLRENKRTKTTAEMMSATGETVYVGSTKSERYARVYRYSAPHPRSALLRVEHVYRREYAKTVGAMVVRDSLRTVCASSAALYGWSHPLVERWGRKVKDIQVSRPERNGGKTLTWLIAQVSPAFRKLVLDGVIEDPVRFLEIYFLSDHSGEKPH